MEATLCRERGKNVIIQKKCLCITYKAWGRGGKCIERERERNLVKIKFCQKVLVRRNGTYENRRKFTAQARLEGFLRREQQTTASCGGD
jgi:hypothetical protein